MEMSRKAYGWTDETDGDAVEQLQILNDAIHEYYSSEPDGMFVAEEGGNIIGTCFGIADSDTKGHISWVGVDPDHQGKGVGSELLEAAVSHLESKGIRTIQLGTDRPRSLPFYSRHGFRIINWTLVKETAGPHSHYQHGRQ